MIGKKAYWVTITVYVLALAAARAQTTVVADPASTDPAKSKDPKIFCPTMKTEEIDVNGRKVKIYELSSAKFLACVPAQPKSDWNVKRSRWTPNDEREFSRFLQVMGESKCNTLEKCLKNPASNTLWSEWDTRAAFYADCADFPYFLRAYYSYKKGLPFSFVTGFRMRALTPEIKLRQENSRKALQEQHKGDPVKQAEKLSEFDKLLGDIRYTWNGNIPRTRFETPSADGESRNFFTMNRFIRDTVSTGTYRMFETQGAPVESDFYSPMIRKGSIGPGTVLYKPAGHAAIVYKVDEKGAIYFIDAHPDNSVTRGQFGRDYSRGNPNMGGGFKNWRPFVLMQSSQNWMRQTEWFEARPDERGVIRQAIHRFLTDAEIQSCVHGDQVWPCDYADEQYRGNRHSPDGDYRKGKFLIGQVEVDYFDYVRYQMSQGQTVDPIDSFRTEVNALCEDIRGRENSVMVAVNASIDKKGHPGVYPRNIYGASGEWESYSSPGRDIRIRARIGNITALAKHYLTVVVKNDPTYSYQPGRPMKTPLEIRNKLLDLKSDFLAIYGEVSRSCEVKYKNSGGTEVRLPFEVLISRLAKVSFDPYMCIERRWGATSTTEMKDCLSEGDEAEFHRLTQFLRNRTERDTAEVMGFTIDELRRMEADKKVDNRVNENQFNLFQILKGL
jgi:hypothetical protein